MSERQTEAERFEQLVRPVATRMLGTLWRILRDPDETDDAHQQVLMKLWRSRHALFRHANPEALILRISSQVALDALRKRRRTPAHVDIDKSAHVLAAAGESPAEARYRTERRDKILSLLPALPRKQSLALTLRLLNGESFQAVAEALGCKEGTARTHVARGGDAILRQLAEWEDEKNEELGHELKST